MTKIDIISGFLGAGKTTLIRKLISEVFAGQKIVLIENEFGEIGIDGGFLQDAGINITEMNSGCICCSLVGDFGEALQKVMDQFAPDRILIEPSGVGKLSDVRTAVENVAEHCDMKVNSLTTVADAKKIRMYMKNFGEFYNNQVESAGTIVLSRTQELSQEKLDAAIEMIREKNPRAVIVTTPWDEIRGEQILEAMEGSVSLADEMKALLEEEHEHHHHDHDEEHEHHHHDHDEEHEHHHHDHDEEHEHHHHDHDEEHEHHHHDHDEEHDHHHHDHGPDCTCGCHDHDHDHEHHHHHADDVFTSWGQETPKAYTAAEITAALEALSDEETYGTVLRAKGIVKGTDGTWIHFDYVPGTPDVRTGSAETTGRLCVIGAGIKEEALAALFGIG